ncbi:hypothetical protein SPRG_13847 [Saprolegnia parasitica CBS 223.65]|uniref:FYVE-type domain-containing protein n=1 Tax=Saprolegnia parasitica (strain CBS 223.65) TaxID=695850 RepID=A0A067BRB2_SAPPC|nr:hypothetical protein SPRG_13847 [Saprolegnia parasitica CBS 223.65]KDO21054.1 hypothetical protein SPRG_13847 [Saprolegnia parasitica CBS 223.65]|eukprot:XP_012208233.1 hypothetical protein SPRG_13847 [Saprolegnia parasitica CBS 223.65]
MTSPSDKATLPLVQAATITRDCHAAGDDLLDHYHDFCSAPTSWRLLRNERDVQLLQGPGRHMRNAYRLATSVTASLDEVKAHTTNLTPTEMKATMDKYADDILDMKVLHRLQTPSVAEPDLQVLVRWFVTECPLPLHNRDFCVAELQNRWTLPSGQRAWGLVQHSVKVPSCPDLLSTVRYRRGQMYHFGLLYVEHPSRPGVLVLFLHLEFDVKGWAPSWLYPFLMARRARSVAKIPDFLAARRLEGEGGTCGSRTGGADERKHCQYCTRQFGPLRWRVHCSNCGEVFCTHCAPPSDVDRTCVECRSQNILASRKSTDRSSGSDTTPSHRVRSWREVTNVSPTSHAQDCSCISRPSSNETSVKQGGGLPLLDYELRVAIEPRTQIDDDWNLRLLRAQTQIRQERSQSRLCYRKDAFC